MTRQQFREAERELQQLVNDNLAALTFVTYAANVMEFGDPKGEQS